MALPNALFKSSQATILIAIDGSTFSEQAAHKGIELAQKLNAKVILLCVIDLSNLVGNSSLGGIIDAEVMKVYNDDAQRVVDEIAKKNPYPETQKLTPEGIPTETILRLATDNKVDMIIMGTHGRKGLSHLFIGSVAEYVVRHSTIPVLVIPSIKEN